MIVPKQIKNDQFGRAGELGQIGGGLIRGPILSPPFTPSFASVASQVGIFALAAGKGVLCYSVLALRGNSSCSVSNRLNVEKRIKDFEK